MQFPLWVDGPGLDQETINSNRLRYLLKLAALHNNSAGSVETFAEACGYTRQAFDEAARRGYMTPGMACAIENFVGKDVAPKHLLCPAKFSE